MGPMPRSARFIAQMRGVGVDELLSEVGDSDIPGVIHFHPLSLSTGNREVTIVERFGAGAGARVNRRDGLNGHVFGNAA